MSKCVKCGNEILTGDIHWEMGLCNNCYNELYKDHKTHISLDNMWLKLAQDFRDENEKLQDKVADLETKLAEKDQELNDICQNYDFQINDFSREIHRLKQREKVLEQDKISFCIEQLEKVKEKILSYEEIYYQFLESGAKVPVFCLENFRVRQTIDNQIKKLKGGK